MLNVFEDHNCHLILHKHHHLCGSSWDYKFNQGNKTLIEGSFVNKAYTLGEAVEIIKKRCEEELGFWLDERLLNKGGN